jgi:hypothetical protein
MLSVACCNTQQTTDPCNAFPARPMRQTSAEWTLRNCVRNVEGGKTGRNRYGWSPSHRVAAAGTKGRRSRRAIMCVERGLGVPVWGVRSYSNSFRALSLVACGVVHAALELGSASITKNASCASPKPHPVAARKPAGGEHACGSDDSEEEDHALCSCVGCHVRGGLVRVPTSFSACEPRVEMAPHPAMQLPLMAWPHTLLHHIRSCLLPLALCSNGTGMQRGGAQCRTRMTLCRPASQSCQARTPTLGFRTL